MPESRSYLFVPGDRPDRFQKAIDAGADAVIIDLEDGVDEQNKDAARKQVADWLGKAQPVYVRINGINSPWLDDDLTLIGQQTGLQGLVIPKAEDPEAIAALAQTLPAELPLLLILESALGIWNARALAEIPRVQRLAFGAIDLQADAGMADDPESLLYARSRLVLAARIAGLPPPIDGITASLTSTSVLARDIEYAKKLGFRAKLCIHPKQVRAVNTGFMPNKEEIKWAQSILTAAEKQGTGATRVQHSMIDKAAIERARLILQWKDTF